MYMEKVPSVLLYNKLIYFRNSYFTLLVSEYGIVDIS